MITHPAILDINSGLRLWRYWGYRSLLVYKSKFLGTRLGLLWPSLSLLIVVGVLGSVWGVVLKKTDVSAYVVYLIAGFAIWQFLSGAVNQAAQGVPSLGAGASVAAIIFERFSTMSITLVSLVPIVLVVRFLLGGPSYAHFWYLLPSIFSLIFWTFGVMLVVMTLVTLFPDFRQLVQSIMRLAFLATPIIWEPSRFGKYENYLWLNPFFPPLETLRFAITGQSSMSEYLYFSVLHGLVILLFGLLLYITQYSRIRARII